MELLTIGIFILLWELKFKIDNLFI